MTENPAIYVADIGVKCTTCGMRFNSKQMPVLLDTGYRNSELRQDFKGKIPQFEPYAICTCPSCGRADWVNNFEVTEEPVVLNQASQTPHLQFRAAALSAERLGRGFLDVGLLYLHAAWCADDNRAYPQAREYRKLSANAFQKSLVDASCPIERRAEIEYLIGELLRRAHEFEASKTYFKQVISRLPGRFAMMARKLMRLAENNDSNAIDFEVEGG